MKRIIKILFSGLGLVILDHEYDTSYKGLDGNDDGATLSAWYIFSSLGFYPIAGSDVYQIGTPLFRKAEVKIGEKILLIEAENQQYVISVR